MRERSVRKIMSGRSAFMLGMKRPELTVLGVGEWERPKGDDWGVVIRDLRTGDERVVFDEAEWERIKKKGLPAIGQPWGEPLIAQPMPSPQVEQLIETERQLYEASQAANSPAPPGKDRAAAQGDPRIAYESRLMNHSLDLSRGVMEDMPNPTFGPLLETIAFLLTGTYVVLALQLPEAADHHFSYIAEKCEGQLVTIMEIESDKRADFVLSFKRLLLQRTQEYDQLQWTISGAPGPATYFAYRKHMRDVSDSERSMKAWIAIQLMVRELDIPTFVQALRTAN